MCPKNGSGLARALERTQSADVKSCQLWAVYRVFDSTLDIVWLIPVGYELFRSWCGDCKAPKVVSCCLDRM